MILYLMGALPVPLCKDDSNMHVTLSAIGVQDTEQPHEAPQGQGLYEALTLTRKWVGR